MTPLLYLPEMIASQKLSVRPSERKYFRIVLKSSNTYPDYY